MINVRDKKILAAFGKNLKTTRIKVGLTQKQLANDMDVEISQISRIERGLINPSLCTIVRIAEHMNVKPQELFNFEIK